MSHSGAPVQLPGTASRPAVFLDRDGTLIEQVHYLSDPARVRLLPGAAEAVTKLRCAGFACVLVTNQSVVGRGIITDARLQEIHGEMNRQLAAHQTVLDGIYYCPDAPSGDPAPDPPNPDRKPGPGMLLRAAAELGLDLASSWMVGDQLTDALAGQNAGCRGSILVETGHSLPLDFASRLTIGRFAVVFDLAAAADLILDIQTRGL